MSTYVGIKKLETYVN